MVPVEPEKVAVAVPDGSETPLLDPRLADLLTFGLAMIGNVSASREKGIRLLIMDNKSTLTGQDGMKMEAVCKLSRKQIARCQSGQGE